MTTQQPDHMKSFLPTVPGTNSARVHVYTLGWNVERMAPYFLRHYGMFADKIYFYDNGSTDSTTAIVKNYPRTEVIPFDTNNEDNELRKMELRNHVYKQSRGVADFVIVVDIDEFLYHPSITMLLTRYKQEGVTFPQVQGYSMVAFRFPRVNDQIYSVVKWGVPAASSNKRCMFHPSIEINYGPGSHTCNPRGMLVESRAPELKPLHFNHVGYGTVVARYRAYRQRRSAVNRQRGWSYHYFYNSQRVAHNFVIMRLSSVNVIDGTGVGCLERLLRTVFERVRTVRSCSRRFLSRMRRCTEPSRSRG